MIGNAVKAMQSRRRSRRTRSTRQLKALCRKGAAARAAKTTPNAARRLQIKWPPRVGKIREARAHGRDLRGLVQLDPHSQDAPGHARGGGRSLQPLGSEIMALMEKRRSQDRTARTKSATKLPAHPAAAPSER